MKHEELTEAELRTALREERPDPGAFRAGVERKLAARRNEGEEGEEPLATSQAAGLLPPVFVVAGTLGGKNVLGKTIAVLSLPALVVGAFGYLLLAGLLAARRLDGSRDTRRQPVLETLGFWRRHWITMFAMLLMLVIIGWKLPLDALLGVLLVSMGGIVISVRRLSSMGLASRRTVGEETGALLGVLGGWMWILIERAPVVLAEPLQAFLILALPLATSILCVALGGPDARRRGLFPRASTRTVVLVPFVLLALMFVFVAPVGTGATPAELARWAEEQAPGPRDTVAWRDLADAVQVLESIEAPIPDLERAASAYARFGADRNPLVDAAAADMGLLDAGGYRRILAERPHQVSSLLDGSGPILALPIQHVLLVALDETNALDVGASDRLARRLVESWRRDDEFATLLKLHEIVHGLERLERPDLLESLAPEVERALEDAWLTTADRARHVGGFVQYYRRGRGHADSRTSGAAIGLMERFGVPEQIDLEMVYRYLRAQATRFGYFTRLDEFDVQPAVALLDFEHSLAPDHEPRLAQQLWSWRYLGAVLALCVLCLAATLGAPRSPGHARPAPRGPH